MTCARDRAVVNVKTMKRRATSNVRGNVRGIYALRTRLVDILIRSRRFLGYPCAVNDNDNYDGNFMVSQVTNSQIPKERERAPVSLRRLLRPAVAAIFRRLYRLSERYVQEDLPPFASKPKNLCIELPRRIAGAECMNIGDNVSLGPNSLLVAQTLYPSKVMQNPDRPVPLQRFEPKIVIGHRVTATGNLTLDAMQSIVIEDDVMFASNVIVMDGLHGFQTANEAYKYQPMWRIAPVLIGRGSWIAQNVVIMPGVTIGEYCIIGANSIVTGDVPPRCMAFGNPARVVKRWDNLDQRWMAVAPGDGQ
jgi:acetyltransferase-like isoleucine patch superfamily enzyme